MFSREQIRGMEEPPPASVMIATLGSEPQVITIVLDLLAERGISVRRMVILHNDPSQEPTLSSLTTLRKELDANPRYPGLKWHGVILRDGQGNPIQDITTPEHAQAVFKAIYRAVEEAKREGLTVHLSAAGGRKAMAMYAALTAQLLFDIHDRLWNLVSTPALLSERRLHPRPGEASLLPVPVLPWRIGLTEKTRFLHQVLTPAEAEVLELVARERLTDKEVAARRYTTNKTTSDHLSVIYSKLHTFLGLRDDVRVDKRTLIAEFSPYFEVMDALQ